MREYYTAKFKREMVIVHRKIKYPMPAPTVRVFERDMSMFSTIRQHKPTMHELIKNSDNMEPTRTDSQPK